MLGIGAVLSACREKAGLSQEKLAELMNRSRSCISKFEKDHKAPDFVTVFTWLDRTNAKEIAGVLGNALISGTTDPAALLQTLLQATGIA